MTKKSRLLILALCLSLLALLSVGFAYADTFNGSGALAFSSGESFVWQDVSEGFNVTFTCMSGSWNGSYVMNCTDEGGKLVFTASTSGTLYVECTDPTATLAMNSITFNAPQPFVAGSSYTITWTYGTAPTPAPSTTTPGSTLPQINNDWLWIYLYSGDVFGFFQAYFINAFFLLDIVAGVITMLFLVPLYIRTKSLLLICIIWVLIGGFFVVAMPMLSGIAILFLALGLAGMFYRLFRGNQ